MDYTEIKKWLKENLSDEKYIHSLGTADCAKELAQMFNLDAQKAFDAGLLHDCAKCLPQEKLLEIINNHLAVEQEELLNYKTLHAPVSAYYAKTLFGISDSEILSAIRWHTLGKMEMTDFEKIIFISDKIEPNTRNPEFSKEIKELLQEDNGLDKALLRISKENIKHLLKKDLRICPITINIYNKLQELMKK